MEQSTWLKDKQSTWLKFMENVHELYVDVMSSNNDNLEDLLYIVPILHTCCEFILYIIL